MNKSSGELQREMLALGYNVNIETNNDQFRVTPWEGSTPEEVSIAQTVLDTIPKDKPKLNARETLRAAFLNEQDIYKRQVVWDAILAEMMLDYVERKPETLAVVTERTGITFDEYNVYED